MENDRQQSALSARAAFALVSAVVLAMFIVKAEAALTGGNMLPLKVIATGVEP
jgi:hypothetical protein